MFQATDLKAYPKQYFINTEFISTQNTLMNVLMNKKIAYGVYEGDYVALGFESYANLRQFIETEGRMHVSLNH